MKKYFSLAFGLFAITLLLRSSQDTNQHGAAGGSGTVRVKLHYTGSGTVDAKHKIGVALWNSTDFMKQGSSTAPLAVKTATDKDGAVTFSDVTTSPVYASAAYDPKGDWDGQSGPPPTGSSLGMYSKTPGTPEPINVKPGKTVTVELSFDDTTKMP